MARTKTWLGRASALTALTASMGLAFSGLAHADTLQDTIADSGAGVTLVAGSPTSGSAGIRVVANSAAGDPDPGCNIDAGENPLRLDIVTPSGVTASPDPLSLTGCGTEFTVSFTASRTAVSGRATVTVLSTPAGGGTYVNQVDIPITVTPPVVTNTAPTVSVTGVSDGQTYEKSGVPQPGCWVTDAEDSNESATPQVSNGPFDSLGQHTVTCSYTDQGTPALTASDTATYTVIRDRDTTAPVITYSLDPATPSGANGWYAGDVSLKWAVTENESPETLQLSGCADRSVTTDQAATTYSCAATSEGGGAAEQSVSIKARRHRPGRQLRRRRIGHGRCRRLVQLRRLGEVHRDRPDLRPQHRIRGRDHVR